MVNDQIQMTKAEVQSAGGLWRLPIGQGSFPTSRPAATEARFALTARVAVLALLIGGIFFVMEHDLAISRATDYTQTAEEMEATSGGGNTLRRAGFLALACLGGYCLASGRARLQVRWPLALAIFAYFGWCFASVLWAEDPGMCLRRLVVLALALVGALGIARAFTVRELLHAAVLITAAIAAIGLFAEVAMGTLRPWSGEYRFSGTVHPNTQGMLLTVLAIGAYCQSRSDPQRARMWWGVLAGALVMLLMTKSRTSLAAAIVSLLVVGGVQNSIRIQLTAASIMAWLAAAGVLILCVAGVDPIHEFIQAALLGRSEDAESLSGRHLIWPEVEYYIARRPWCGYGFESFWTADRIEVVFEELGWGVREAHNGYLETMLSVGIVGLILALLMILTGLATCVSRLVVVREAAYGLPLGIMVFGLLNAGLESAMAWLFLGTFLAGCTLLRVALFDSSEAATTGTSSA